MFVVKLFVAVFFVEIQCADCSSYKSEESCNYKGEIGGCKWNASATSGSKCKGFLCSYATTQAECENNGILTCYWNGTGTTPCKDPACVYLPPATCVSLGATFGLTCLAGETSCSEKSCFDFSSSQTACETDSAAAGYKCRWTGSLCTSRFCSDKDGSTKADCEAYDAGSGSSCGWQATESKCKTAYCSVWSTANDADCIANNGKLECVWNASASNPDNKCSQKGCSDFKSEKDCDANAAKYSCTWWKILSTCRTLTCGDLDDSQQTCEDDHPACHYDGSCKVGGSAAIVVGVSGTLSMLILFLLAFNFF